MRELGCPLDPHACPVAEVCEWRDLCEDVETGERDLEVQP